MNIYNSVFNWSAIAKGIRVRVACRCIVHPRAKYTRGWIIKRNWRHRPLWIYARFTDSTYDCYRVALSLWFLLRPIWCTQDSLSRLVSIINIDHSRYQMSNWSLLAHHPFILLPYSVIGERCLIKESLFHRDLSSSWLPDNKMILSKDRYGYFFRKRRTKKTDVRDKNHKIVSLFVWTESIFEVRLLSSKWLAKIWKRKGGKLVENFVALARSFVLSIPPNTFFFSQVDFFNSIIRDN